MTPRTASALALALTSCVDRQPEPCGHTSVASSSSSDSGAASAGSSSGSSSSGGEPSYERGFELSRPPLMWPQLVLESDLPGEGDCIAKQAELVAAGIPDGTVVGPCVELAEKWCGVGYYVSEDRCERWSEQEAQAGPCRRVEGKVLP